MPKKSPLYIARRSMTKQSPHCTCRLLCRAKPALPTRKSSGYGRNDTSLYVIARGVLPRSNLLTALGDCFVGQNPPSSPAKAAGTGAMTLRFLSLRGALCRSNLLTALADCFVGQNPPSLPAKAAGIGAMTIGLLNNNLPPDWGERCLTRFHPDFTGVLPVTPWTDNGVCRSPYQAHAVQAHARGWFSPVTFRGRLSVNGLSSLADELQLLVPVNAV